MSETPRPPESHLPPPGIYTDGDGVQRYWDGSSWTEHLSGHDAQRSNAHNPKVTHKTKRSWYTKKGFLITASVVAVLLIGGVAAGVGGALDNESTDSAAASSWRDSNTDAEQETAQAAEERAAEAKAAKAAKAKRKKKIANAKFVSKRRLARVFKNPDNHEGDVFKVWGEVVQFDAATGPDAFLADTAHADTRSYGFFDGNSAFFMGEISALEKLVEEDVFTATVEGNGSLSYDTQVGGNTTVPLFDVIKINRAN